MTRSISGSHLRSQLRRNLELLQVLVDMNLYARYRGSFLGVYWSMLNPIIMMSIYTVIFGKNFAPYYRIPDDPHDNPILNYLLSALVGLITINFFTAATSQTLPSVVQNGSILNKVRLPVAVFPVSAIAANIFQFLIGSMPLLVLITLVKSHNILNLIALPFPFIALILVSLGTGLTISALFVFFRDLPYFYELVVFVISLTTPVFYPATIVPDKFRFILALNPLSSIMESFRQIALKEQLPDLMAIVYALMSGIIVFVVGFVVFRKLQGEFMDLL